MKQYTVELHRALAQIQPYALAKKKVRKIKIGLVPPVFHSRGQAVPQREST
jgi:hypothetical protein